MSFFASKKTLLTVAILISITSIAHPISEETAKYAAIASGAIAGVGAAILTHKTLTYIHNFDSQAKPILTSGAVGLTVGGVACYYFYKWLYGLTPSGRIAALNAIVARVAANIQTVDNDPLSSLFTDVDSLIAVTVAQFDSNSWPLVLSKEALSKNLKILAQARNEISVVLQEIHKNESCMPLAQDCSQLDLRAIALASNIQTNLIAIINHEKYNFQVQLYEQVNGAERYLRLQTQENDKQRKHQRDIINQSRHNAVNFNIG